MANTKISDFNADTTPDVADLVVTVDVSDVTDDAAGTNKKVTLADLGKGLATLSMVEQSSDPSDPAEGKSVIWQSDGTDTGSDGDILIKITAGGVTKTVTLIDFSVVS